VEHLLLHPRLTQRRLTRRWAAGGSHELVLKRRLGCSSLDVWRDNPAAWFRDQTNAKGEARIGPLEDGTYVVSSELAAFEADYDALVRVTKRRPARIVFMMYLAPTNCDIGRGIGSEPSITPMPIMKVTPKPGAARGRSALPNQTVSR